MMDGEQAEAPTILLVEDDRTLLSTLSFNLTRQQYHVLTAANGEDALQVVAEHGPALDLVLLDVMLPGINGFHVLRHVRRTYDMPVLMLSARGEVQDKIDGLELGADDYIVKPFVLAELLARVRAAVRRGNSSAPRPPRVLHRGDLRIEPERRRAVVRDSELQLRPKEFGLLLTMALEPDRVFERQHLLDTVWGDDVIVDERTIDVHISWLRSKLQAAGLTPDCIRTVYGSGYRFVVPQSTVTHDAPHLESV